MIRSSTATEQKERVRDQRREAYVAAARKAFFASGYGDTSMSAISAAVGGSKTTLWALFPSKQDLFVAVCDDLVERYGRALEWPLDPDGPIESALRRFGAALLATIHSEPVIDLHRLVIGEAGRFPELARLFYERAPARGKARMAEIIEGAMKRSELRPGDSRTAARQFVSLCQAGSHQMHLLGLVPAPGPEEMERELDAAVDSFMRAWRA